MPLRLVPVGSLGTTLCDGLEDIHVPLEQLDLLSELLALVAAMRCCAPKRPALGAALGRASRSGRLRADSCSAYVPNCPKWREGIP